MSAKIGSQSRMMLRLVTSVSRQAESYLLTSTPLAKDIEQQLVQVYGLKVVYLPQLSMSNPFRIYEAWKEMKKAVQVIQPDLVHVHGAWNPLLYLMELTARKNGYVTCVSTYGGMAPEILNTEFFKKRMLPLLFYQAPLIRHSTSLLAINEKEWEDIRNLNLKKRVEILPEITSGAGNNEVLSEALLAAYRKAIDSSYKRFLTADEELFVERCVIAASTKDAGETTAHSRRLDDSLSFRRIFLYAYDEDVMELLHAGALNLSYQIPTIHNVGDIPRYADKKAKRKGGLQQLPLPVRKIKVSEDNPLEYNVVSALLRAQKEGIKRLSLRHKTELYDIFRNQDFDEGVVGAELSRLRLKRFTKKIQNMLHEMYNMPVGYDIF